MRFERTLLLFVVTAGWAGSPPQDVRKTLDVPTEIQGYPCAKGYARFYVDGQLERCSVSHDIAFGEAHVPSESIIVLRPDGKPNYVFLSHDTSIRGYKCQGGSWLGAGEASTTGFYPSGKLKLCWLAGDQDVQAIPCRGSGFFVTVFHGDAGTQFHENGKLHSCGLSKDFGGLRRGQRFVQAP